MKRNDLFLILLLLASLSLNVYLGWNVKRLKSMSRTMSAERQSPPSVLEGTSVEPITAMNSGGKQETLTYAGYGKPTVFYVFSPSCIWCERNNQNINAIANLRGESFRFVGISLAEDGLSAYIESHHLTFPVYTHLTSESIQMLGLGSTPQTVVISPDGHVLKNWTGAYGASIQPQVEEFFDVRLPGLAAKH